MLDEEHCLYAPVMQRCLPGRGLAVLGSVIAKLSLPDKVRPETW